MSVGAASEAGTIVVGGGVAGLALARELVAAGDEVVVVEAGARAGGLLRTERRDGYVCEWGANAFLDDPGGAAALGRELGVDMVAAAPAAKQRWVFRGGARRVVPTSPPGLFATDLLGWRGKLRLFAEPFVGRGRAQDPTVDEFFRRRVGREVAEALVAPFVVGVFAGESDQLSMAAAFPKLWQLERDHGGLLRGLLARRKRQPGAKAPRPSLVAARAGAGALVDALAASLGPRLRTGARVARLERAGAAWRVVLDGGASLLAARVVLATPAAATAALVEPHDAELAALARAVPVAPLAVAYAGFALAELGVPVDAFGLLVARGETPRVLGIVFESTVWPDRAPAGHALFRLIYGGARDPAAAALDDGALRAQARADLATTLGITAEPRFFHVARPVGGIPQYPPGHLARVAAAEARAAALGLVLAGNTWRGVAVNDLVADARALAARLRGAR